MFKIKLKLKELIFNELTFYFQRSLINLILTTKEVSLKEISTRILILF